MRKFSAEVCELHCRSSGTSLQKFGNLTCVELKLNASHGDRGQYEFGMTSVWLRYDISMTSVWLQYEFNMSLIWDQYEINMRLIWDQCEINMNFHWLWLVWDTDLFLTVNFYLEHGWYRWHSKESRRWGVFSDETPLLLNSLDRNKHSRMKLFLRSQGDEELVSQETPLLLNSLDRYKHSHMKLFLRSQGDEEFFHKRLLYS